MVLVDTSVWIDHLRSRVSKLAVLLEEGEVAVHPFVIGELACGNLKNRTEVLSLLQALPKTPRLEDHEALLFIDRHGLAGCGLGLIDVHLLASCRLGAHFLWTRDKRLKTVANDLGLHYEQPSG